MHAWDKAQGLKAFLGVQGGLAPTPQSQKLSKGPPQLLFHASSSPLSLLEQVVAFFLSLGLAKS